MKKCEYCGQLAADDTKFCQNCGHPLPEAAAPAFSQPEEAPAFNASPMGFGPSRAQTKKEFLDLPGNEKLKKNMKTSAIVCYICAGITLLVMVVLGGSALALIDVLLLVVLGLGVHLKQSKACAVTLLAYAILNCILSMVQNGTPGGYLAILAGIYAVTSTFGLDKQWKAYQQGNTGTGA